jgi:hypothetical protein
VGFDKEKLHATKVLGWKNIGSRVAALPGSLIFKKNTDKTVPFTSKLFFLKLRFAWHKNPLF